METENFEIYGLGASPGIYRGRARVILDINRINELEEGDILITKYTDPAWTEAFVKISGIVTDEGGITSHAAIVARELKIPAVVGTKQSTKIIRDGEEIIVDGYKGRVIYKLK